MGANRKKQEDLDRAAKKLPFPLKEPLREELNLKIYVPEMPAGTDLLPWAAWYLKKEVYGSLSDKTADGKVFDLQKFINFFYYYFPGGDLKYWDKASSNDFLGKLEKAKYARGTIRRIHANLSAFSTFLVEMKIYDHVTSPMRKVKAPPLNKTAPKSIQLVSEDGDVVIKEGESVLSMLHDTAERIMMEKNKNTPPQKCPVRDFAIMAVLRYTGLRVSELCGLQIKQYQKDMYSQGAYFRGVVGKGDKPRDVYMQKKGVEAVDLYIKEERKKVKSGALFLTYFGTTMTRNNVWQILKFLGRETEKKYSNGGKILINPHRFRHERCYTLLNAPGLTITEVADELGHNDLKYLKIYGDRSDKTRSEKLKDV